MKEKRSNIGWFLGLAVVVAAILGAQPAQAAVYVLTDGNSEVWVDTDTSFGAHSWNIDGTDHLRACMKTLRSADKKEHERNQVPDGPYG